MLHIIGPISEQDALFAVLSLIRPNSRLLSDGEGKDYSKFQAVVDQRKPTNKHPLQH